MLPRNCSVVNSDLKLQTFHILQINIVFSVGKRTFKFTFKNNITFTLFSHNKIVLTINYCFAAYATSIRSIRDLNIHTCI